MTSARWIVPAIIAAAVLGAFLGFRFAAPPVEPEGVAFRLGVVEGLRSGDSDESGDALVLPSAEVDRYVTALKAHGPFAGRKRGERYRWFEATWNVRGLVSALHKGRRYVLLSAAEEHAILPGADWQVEYAFPEISDAGIPSVGMALDERGGERLNALSKAYPGCTLAILVDGRAVMAARMRGEIPRRFIIEGFADVEEVQKLVEAIRKDSARLASRAPVAVPADE